LSNDTERAVERPALGADLIIPLLGSSLAIYYLVSTAELDWEARSAGLFVGSVLLTLCAIQLVRILGAAVTGRGTLGLGGLLSNTLHNRRRLALIGLVALFIATISWAGTTLGLWLLLIASMLVMGVRSPIRLLAVATTASAVVYVLLILILNTRLPRGILEKLIAGALGQST
jgi:hypothetical protein